MEVGCPGQRSSASGSVGGALQILRLSGRTCFKYDWFSPPRCSPFHLTIEPGSGSACRKMVAESPDNKQKQDLTAQGLDGLLALLDSDRDRAGEKYEEIRFKLTKYFEWEGCPFVDEHADETINRVARAIQQGKEIRDLRAYFFGVARLIHFESLRDLEKQRRVAAELFTAPAARREGDGSDEALDCLERCLASLPSEGRDLIMKYYQGDQIAKIRNRRNLAQALGLESNALRNRALRLRSKLENCVMKCMKQRDGLTDSGTNIYGQR